jgi:hypothetical protein
MITTVWILGIFVALLLTLLIYTSKSHWVIKSLALIVFLVSGMLVYETYVRYLGAPIQMRPVGEHVYIHHIITSTPTIIIWTNKADVGFRLYEYEFNREDAAKLHESQELIDGPSSAVVIIDFDSSFDSAITIRTVDAVNNNQVKN